MGAKEIGGICSVLRSQAITSTKSGQISCSLKQKKYRVQNVKISQLHFFFFLMFWYGRLNPGGFNRSSEPSHQDHSCTFDLLPSWAPIFLVYLEFLISSKSLINCFYFQRASSIRIPSFTDAPTEKGHELFPGV